MILGVSLVLVLLVSLSFASALTASIGNSRRIVRIDPGETVTGKVLVRNVNDVAVTITATVSGDLAEDLKLREDTLELQPGQEDNLHYTVKVEEEGTTETKINVGFKSEDAGGVGLAATLMVIAREGEGGSDDPDEPIDEPEEPVDGGEGTGEGVEGGDGVTRLNPGSGSNEGSSGTLLLVVLAVLLVAVLFLLFLFYLAGNGKRRAKSQKSSTKRDA